MAGNGGSALPPPPPLPASAAQALAEGISLVLSRWTALQIAVENGWGGRDSRLRAQELADSILLWFSNSNDALYIDDLETMLDDAMMLSFNAEIEDGSIEEVAEQLMILHEECLQGKSDLLSRLRQSAPAAIAAISQSRQIVGEEEDESSDEEPSEMMVDRPKSEATSPSPNHDDGWSVVAPRRGRGKR